MASISGWTSMEWLESVKKQQQTFCASTYQSGYKPFGRLLFPKSSECTFVLLGGFLGWLPGPRKSSRGKRHTKRYQRHQKRRKSTANPRKKQPTSHLKALRLRYQIEPLIEFKKKKCMKSLSLSDKLTFLFYCF